MALDYEKLKTASAYELAALALCEFSRFVDAIERIAPDIVAAPATTEPPTAPLVCPHPAELRINKSTMGQEAFQVFQCGVCQEVVGG